MAAPAGQEPAFTEGNRHESTGNRQADAPGLLGQHEAEVAEGRTLLFATHYPGGGGPGRRPDTRYQQRSSAGRRHASGNKEAGRSQAALAEGINPLTRRERQVLAASAGGSLNSEIAARLYLSEGTVRNYLSSCIQKTGARNRTEALRIAEERGWLG